MDDSLKAGTYEDNSSGVSSTLGEFKAMYSYRDWFGIGKNFIGVGIILAGLYNIGMYNLTSGIPLLFGLIFGLICLYLLVNILQQYHGVTKYVFDGQQIIIPHGVGSTRIPLNQVSSATVGEITSHTHTTHGRDSKGRTTTQRTTHYTDTSGNPVKIGAGFLIGGAPYTSQGGGKCLLVKLKNNSLIALTPEDPEGMAKALGERAH